MCLWSVLEKCVVIYVCKSDFCGHCIPNFYQVLERDKCPDSINFLLTPFLQIYLSKYCISCGLFLVIYPANIWHSLQMYLVHLWPSVSVIMKIHSLPPFLQSYFPSTLFSPAYYWLIFLVMYPANKWYSLKMYWVTFDLWPFISFIILWVKI